MFHQMLTYIKVNQYRKDHPYYRHFLELLAVFHDNNDGESISSGQLDSLTNKYNISPKLRLLSNNYQKGLLNIIENRNIAHDEFKIFLEDLERNQENAQDGSIEKTILEKLSLIEKSAPLSSNNIIMIEQKPVEAEYPSTTIAKGLLLLASAKSLPDPTLEIRQLIANVESELTVKTLTFLKTQFEELSEKKPTISPLSNITSHDIYKDLSDSTKEFLPQAIESIKAVHEKKASEYEEMKKENESLSFDVIYKDEFSLRDIYRENIKQARDMFDKANQNNINVYNTAIIKTIASKETRFAKLENDYLTHQVASPNLNQLEKILLKKENVKYVLPFLKLNELIEVNETARKKEHMFSISNAELFYERVRMHIHNNSLDAVLTNVTHYLLDLIPFFIFAPDDLMKLLTSPDIPSLLVEKTQQKLFKKTINAATEIVVCFEDINNLLIKILESGKVLEDTKNEIRKDQVRLNYQFSRVLRLSLLLDEIEKSYKESPISKDMIKNIENFEKAVREVKLKTLAIDAIQSMYKHKEQIDTILNRNLVDPPLPNHLRFLLEEISDILSKNLCLKKQRPSDVTDFDQILDDLCAAMASLSCKWRLVYMSDNDTALNNRDLTKHTLYLYVTKDDKLRYRAKRSGNNADYYDEEVLASSQEEKETLKSITKIVQSNNESEMSENYKNELLNMISKQCLPTSPLKPENIKSEEYALILEITGYYYKQLTQLTKLGLVKPPAEQPKIENKSTTIGNKSDANGSVKNAWLINKLTNLFTKDNRGAQPYVNNNRNHVNTKHTPQNHPPINNKDIPSSRHSENNRSMVSP